MEKQEIFNVVIVMYLFEAEIWSYKMGTCYGFLLCFWNIISYSYLFLFQNVADWLFATGHELIWML